MNTMSDNKDNMEDHQKELSTILGIDKYSSEYGYATTSKKKPASWAEIYVAIGKLQEAAREEPDYPTVTTTGDPLGCPGNICQS